MYYYNYKTNDKRGILIIAYDRILETFENIVSKQAFSKQRRNLNPEIFVELNKDYVRRIYEQAEIKKYKGYLVTAI